MTSIRRKRLDQPDEARSFPHGSGGLVRVGPLVVGHARLEPGWRWSVDIRPRVGTDSCQLHHVHVLLSGRFAVRMDDGEEAAFTAGDVFDLPPGHDAWVVGDGPVELLDISGNVAEFGLRATPTTTVATILMSDIVGSTAIATRIGDARWRQLLGDHNRAVRAELARFRGRELDTTGDGFLATFDSVVAALRCAASIRDAVAHVGLEVRIGVHTGEINVGPEDAGGIAVHAAARVMSLAGPSEVVVSAVTRALASGGDVRFVPRGRHVLKGFPEPMEVFALA